MLHLQLDCDDDAGGDLDIAGYLGIDDGDGDDGDGDDDDIMPRYTPCYISAPFPLLII